MKKVAKKLLLHRERVKVLNDLSRVGGASTTTCNPPTGYTACVYQHCLGTQNTKCHQFTCDIATTSAATTVVTTVRMA